MPKRKLKGNVLEIYLLMPYSNIREKKRKEKKKK
jgi:hypothetical protein